MTVWGGLGAPPETLRSIVEESSDCIKLLDPDARLLSMNAGGLRAMEIDDFNACRALQWPEFWPEDSRPLVEAALQRARQGERCMFEGQAPTFRGTLRWWEVKVSPVLDDAGRVTQLLAVSRDITARKEAELALKALNATLEAQVEARTRQLEQHARAQDAFIALTEMVGDQTDVLAVAQQAIEVLQAFLPGASVSYLTPGPGGWVARVWNRDLPPSVVQVVTAGISAEHPVLAQVVHTRQPVFIDHWVPPPEHLVAAPELSQTVAGYPLLLGGQVQGILGVGLRQARRWGESDQALVRAVGSALNLALERAEDLRRLAERGQELDERNRELSRERTFLRAVLESMSEGVVACDEHGQLTLFNDAARRAQGQDAAPMSPEEWAGHYDLLESDGVTPLPPEQVPLLRALRGEQVREAPLAVRTRAGAVMHVLASGRSMPGPDGQPLGAVVTLRDVTERRAAEQALSRSAAQLRRSNAELRAANEELEAFAYSTSHDLRTPIRHVQSFTDLARRALASTPNSAATRHLGFVEQAAARMSTMIDGLLLLSRSSRQALQPGAVQLEELVQRAREAAGPARLDGAVEWRIAPLPEVWGDPALVQQILQHLFANALKFSRVRAVSIIEVWAEEDAERWSLHVRDNGVGFDPQYRSRLFGVFQRLHSEREFEGTGVGLATVRRLVLRHGGSVAAHAVPDGGATFTFTLPKPL